MLRRAEIHEGIGEARVEFRSFANSAISTSLDAACAPPAQREDALPPHRTPRLAPQAIQIEEDES